jgi:hypothetical protein
MPDSCCICFSLANKSREFLIGEIGEAADHPDVLRLNRPAVAVAQQHIRGRHSLPRILQGRDKGLDRVSGVLPREFLDAFRNRWPTMRVARLASMKCRARSSQPCTTLFSGSDKLLDARIYTPTPHRATPRRRVLRAAGLAPKILSDGAPGGHRSHDLT